MGEQFITPIQFGTWNQVAAGQTNPVSGREGVSVFGQMFNEMIDTVKQSEKTVQEKEYLLATGQLDNPHELTAAVAEAQLAVDLLAQVRNKTLEAYNELMRISL